jgi:endo-1,4-beta-xylanase
MLAKKLITGISLFGLGLATIVSLNMLVMAKPKQTSGISAAGSVKRDFSIVGKRSLKQRAAAKGIIYGIESTYDDIKSDQKLANLIAKEGKLLTPGLEFKWHVGDKSLRPDSLSFDFTRSDWMAKFASTNGMLLHGHTLVWHESLPPWFAEKVNKQNAKQMLTQHIQKVAGRYAGKIHSWDVVNEAVDIYYGQKPLSLRKTPWLDLLGSDYIEIAFRAAAKADPKALLVYNDYGLEYDTPEDEAKRTAVLKLLKQLKSKGVPIHTLGIQSHLEGHETRFNPKKFKAFLKQVAALDLKIMITELDVNDQKLPVNPAVRDRIVAGIYEDYLSAALSEKAVTSVVVWGITDRISWLSTKSPRADGAALRPLPLDANLKPKLVWNAIARAFDRAPKR